VVDGQALIEPGNTHYDLIDGNGRHHLAVAGVDMCADPHIRAVLRLRFWHRLPYVGTLLRNHWAKRNGARLY